MDQDSNLLLISDARSNELSQKALSSPESTAAVPVVPVRTITPQESPSSRYNDEPEAPDELRFATAEVDRLQLMDHYARIVADSITSFAFPNDQGLSIWRVSVPQLAFRHEYLLHGLMFVSSLHYAAINPSEKEKYYSLAIRHYNTGLTLFRAQLADINPENIDALFGFSCMIGLYSFRIHSTGLSQMNSLAKIHEVMTVIRGASVIVASGMQWLSKGLWGATLILGSVGTPGKLAPEIEESLDGLSQRIDSTISTSANRELYVEAIELIRRSLWISVAGLPSQLAVILFPIRVPADFLNMMCIAEPLALSILAHYGVVLYWQRHHMWVEGWGKETVDAIHQALPPDWLPCVSWTVQEVAKDQ